MAEIRSSSKIPLRRKHETAGYDDLLEDKFPGNLDCLVNKVNKPQLRVPDTSCIINPAKRLCTDYSRDACPQQNTSSKESHSCISEMSEVMVSYPEEPFHIPFPDADVDTDRPTNAVSNSNQAWKSSNETDSSVGQSISARQAPLQSEPPLQLHTGSVGQLDTSNIQQHQGSDVKCQTGSRDNIVQNSRSGLPVSSNQGNSVLGNQNNRRSRSGDGETGDYITPKRKRKFPGPAGILPQLGPGKSLDLLSPTTLNTTAPVTHKSPQEDSVIICSQTTEDLFTDTPWQAMLSDLGEDGQRLLRKFSIATTLFKAGKKQLQQGKAALIFGIIDTLESHGSEASVTLRDKSGRMQGTIHQDLLKDHETELQMGTVLVLKQVSIISLSNRNHYLNITPNNVVAVYRNGEDSVKSRKFHGSQESLQSVLSALEKKVACQRASANSSLTLTPSVGGSSRQSQSSSSPSTPQLFGASPVTPNPNQSLFPQGSNQTQMPPTGLKTPVPVGVRDVSVVQRSTVPSVPGQNTWRFKPKTPGVNSPAPTRPGLTSVNRPSPAVPDIRPSTFSTPVSHPRLIRPHQLLNTPVLNAALSVPQTGSSPTVISTQNTDFKIVSVKDNATRNTLTTNIANRNDKSDGDISNTSVANPDATDNRPSLSAGESTSAISGATCHTSVSTPSVSCAHAGKSKWKFKSPPGSQSSSPALNLSESSSIIQRMSAGNKHCESRVLEKSGMSSRSCQLNVLNASNQSNTPLSSSKVSESGNLISARGKENSEDPLWDDDLSDDLLSQLSEDLS